MGDYSEFCSVSAIPFDYGQEYVAIPVEPSRFFQVREKEFYPNWLPKGWPIFGKYNDGGGIPGMDSDLSYILIHKSVWDNAHKYWHYRNSENWKGFDVKEIQERFIKDKEYRKHCLDNSYNPIYRENWSDTDIIYYHMKRTMDRGDFNGYKYIYLDKLFLGENVSAKGEEIDSGYLGRNEFAELICQKILNGFTEEDSSVLNKMICIWGAPKVTGKPLIPTSIANVPEQYPEYEQRIKLLAFHTKLSREFAKKRKEKTNCAIECTKGENRIEYQGIPYVWTETGNNVRISAATYKGGFVDLPKDFVVFDGNELNSAHIEKILEKLFSKKGSIK